MVYAPPQPAPPAQQPRDPWPRWKTALAIVLGVLLFPILLVVALVVGVYLLVSSGSLKAWASRTSKSLDEAASQRGGLLLLGGVSYALGYVVWSVYSWQRGLGVLPGLQFQYILAGLFPLVFTWFLVLMFSAAMDWLQTTKSGAVATISGLLLSLGLPIALAAFVLFPLFGWIVAGAYVFLTIVIATTGFMFARIGVIPVAVPWGLVSVIIAGFAFYALAVYPNIPQALGGLQPQCGYLVVKQDEVGSETLSALGGSPSLDDAVASTGAVDILFQGGGFVLVQPQEPSSQRVYRLDDSTVTSIQDCAD